MRAPTRRAGRPRAAERAAREGAEGAMLRALADGTRRRILLLLAAEGEMPVHALAERFPVSRPMVSKHLRVLAAAGLVEARVAGRERRYRLSGSAAARSALELVALDEEYARAFARLREHLELERDGARHRSEG